MPYPNIKNLPLWPSCCKTVTIREPFPLKTSNTETCFLQIISGKAVVQYENKRHTLAVRSVVVLGRNTSIVLEPQEQLDCQFSLLCLHHSLSRPHIDLNHLCLNISLVDSFLGRKTRFCILTDKEYIYVTFSAILNEWENDYPERDALLFSLFHEFFIKLARSFHAHNRPTGIQYLTSAREYIKQNFQEPLTLEKIAAHVGISRSYLAQLFATHINRSVIEYIQAIRCDHAAYLLSTTNLAIIDIAMETGFNNRQHFSRTFSKIYGISPHEYRQANRVAYGNTPGNRHKSAPFIG
ncbi:AraC family transcriptional regulator [Eisenbergiella porci]|uniref:AraC family transcriptional regulator n=1 Tax=Eisenbergiella porci TaxID=2652274 RepID=UPI002A83A478|nr:AraC family transcriptional regulator [Eisenbergiella porci]